MTSLAVRDPLADYLLTPGNSALLIIDDQPVQAIREGFEVYPVVDAVGGSTGRRRRIEPAAAGSLDGHPSPRDLLGIRAFVCSLRLRKPKKRSE